MAFELKRRDGEEPEPEEQGSGFADRLLGTITRPLDTLQGLADGAEVGRAALVVVLVGLAWAGFSAALDAAGHEPSFTGNPLPARGYYGVQAWFVLPVLVVAWLVLGGVAHLLSRLLADEGTPPGDLPSLLAPLGFAWAVPILVLFLVPDILVYALGGFVELGFLVRLTAPLTALWVVVLAAAAVRAARGLSFGRAAAVIAPALLAAGVVVGAVVR